MRTQICIIGGGPSGLLLGQLLHRQGIETVILERKTKDYVLGRIRAGILERGTVRLMREAGVGARMDRECFVHDGTVISYGDEEFRIDFTEHTGSHVVVYGQTEMTRDLYEAREAVGAPIVYEAEGVTIHGADTDAAHVTYVKNGTEHRIDCDFIAGCDGFHGVSRQAIPLSTRKEYEKIYPFGWLGVLSETPPVHEELIYAGSERGFALCSMRNANLSRYYIQCALSDSPADWTDAAFWQELRRRIPEEHAEALITGPTIEKSIAPLRSFVTEPMRWGRLFLCGDAAHIVPPTGAKGLNTAASDVHYLYTGLTQHYQGDDEGLDRYSERALSRVWKAERFSWWMTNLLHRYPHMSEFDIKMQQADVAFLKSNTQAQSVLAQNYIGLPY
ncbi:4-hydroxybenzoate 3-monooxygenase [Ponticoccus alexandrii]|uniref:4-hydroxybenzoate 3-monooxygenase n=2 Tax=Rhodobacterales TaxID=204455 RepID=A0ABX7FBV2_9RHOB|nr:4-hydroxybenzoate 3-monooxygenase [Ponticoccus alexandrii]ETA51078.1 4-hydroxybenzoate 3-monooxygenase [Rhodobacteraceae bacterium PD-2]QRF67969.1 4-hydroxybenzoate 3-monooxygenase [Ponticoccus alexandrii]